MKRAGSSDLYLMGGHIPRWLFGRMVELSGAMVEAILVEYGHQALLAKLSDPFWFQSFGAVIGMDWNSSGVTTAVMRALGKSINPVSRELGLFICGGKGKESLKTPEQLLRVGAATGLDGSALGRASKLTAKVDNTALQDGHQLYLHNFIVSEAGDWTVIQQGMNPEAKSARRYHWHSGQLQSYIRDPHAAVCGEQQGNILNLVAREATPTQTGILEITREVPEKILREIPRLQLPHQSGVRAKDIDLKRLGGILHLARVSETQDFEELLLLPGMGPRTLQSLTLVSEVIHGTPSRFSDPARFSFAHGSKGGRPFPVPTKVYDETITTLRRAVDLAKIGQSDRQKAIAKLSEMARAAEQVPEETVEELLENERKNAWKYGGRTMHGPAEPPQEDRNEKDPQGEQLNLFGD